VYKWLNPAAHHLGDVTEARVTDVNRVAMAGAAPVVRYTDDKHSARGVSEGRHIFGQLIWIVVVRSLEIEISTLGRVGGYGGADRILVELVDSTSEQLR
jgi:hypothetical protein